MLFDPLFASHGAFSFLSFNDLKCYFLRSCQPPAPPPPGAGQRAEEEEDEEGEAILVEDEQASALALHHGSIMRGVLILPKFAGKH